MPLNAYFIHVFRIKFRVNLSSPSFMLHFLPLSTHHSLFDFSATVHITGFAVTHCSLSSSYLPSLRSDVYFIVLF
jgi:hypothetical protein